ncbi:hypothetical protein LCGC14_0878770 [marine sediment metagenome]|uniref:Uncharacterized protein n=1 Tax=marine sediment metagenome TaxID=412755 RepID=A0A0F9PN70_9ZZZZ
MITVSGFWLQPCAFRTVAPSTSWDDVFNEVEAALRHRNDMVSGEFLLSTTISATVVKFALQLNPLLSRMSSTICSSTATVRSLVPANLERVCSVVSSIVHTQPLTVLSSISTSRFPNLTFMCDRRSCPGLSPLEFASFPKAGQAGGFSGNFPALLKPELVDRLRVIAVRTSLALSLQHSLMPPRIDTSHVAHELVPPIRMVRRESSTVEAPSIDIHRHDTIG